MIGQPLQLEICVEVGKRGKLIVLDGGDGVGKTTLAERVAGSPNLGNMRHVSRRHVPDHPKFVNDAMSRINEVLWKIGDSRDFDAEFWISLQAAWFNGLSKIEILPLLRSGIDVLVDGWVYKFFAKLELQGYLRRELDARFEGVLIPDIVILVERDIRSILKTKSDLRPTEMGLHADYVEVSEASFFDYQQRISQVLKRYAEDPRWHIWEMQEEYDVDRSTLEIVNLIEAVLSD